MKMLIALLALLGMTLPAEAQIAAHGGVPTDGILSSIANGTIQPAGDHYLVTRQDSRSPVKLVFSSHLGLGINRASGQWWVLPITAHGSHITVNTNLWVLPEKPHSQENSWCIKLKDGESIAARLDDLLDVEITGDTFDLYKSEARPHSDTFNNRYSFDFADGQPLANALAGFYWGTMLPSVIERTRAAAYPYSDGYVVSTLNPKSYAGTYPDVDHEFQIKGRLALGSALDLDIVRRMIALQFRVMNDDPEKLFRIPCSIQPSGLREYEVRRDSEDGKENAEMFLLTGNIEVLEESWRYYQATRDTAWLRANIVNLENAASLTIANTDQYGRVWSDVYYEDQVIKDGRATQAGAFAAYTFGLLARMETILGRADKASRYSGYRKKIAAALVQPLPMGFWDETNHRFVDWVDRNGRVHDHIHLLSNALPVLFGYATAAQARSVQSLIDANFASFQRFPTFLAADVAGYTKSEIGNGGPYDLSAAGRYWYWDAALWDARKRGDVLLHQLKTVADEAARTDYFMGERFDMDHVYYVDGKDWHGAEMYYEYPCVYTAVLVTDLLGITTAPGPDVSSPALPNPALSIHPHLPSYGAVDLGIPLYALKYTYDASGFALKNRANTARRFQIDLSALYPGTARYQLQRTSASAASGHATTPNQIVGARSFVELSAGEELRWTPIH